MFMHFTVYTVQTGTVYIGFSCKRMHHMKYLCTEFLHGRRWRTVHFMVHSVCVAATGSHTTIAAEKYEIEYQNMCELHRNGTAKTRQDHQ